MFYVSLGDDSEFFARPKQLPLKVVGYGEFINEYDLVWNATTACFIDTMYLLDKHDNLFWKMNLVAPVSARKRDEIKLPAGQVRVHLEDIKKNRTPHGNYWKLT